MCGRYTLDSPDAILEQLGLAGAFPQWKASFNIAPGTGVPCVVNRDKERVRLLRWGLVPQWARDPRLGARMINARRETLAEKKAFREAYSRRRCLVLADGFYEWRREGKSKVPFLVRRRDRQGFCFAGLWEHWRGSEGQLSTVAIVTAPAGPLVLPVHDRMPVIVAKSCYQRWLEPGQVPAQALDEVVMNPDYEGFEAFEVSTLVNSVSNDGPQLIEPGPTQQRLF